MNTISAPDNGAFPLKLWKFAQLFLLAVLIVGLVFTLMLAFGAANPPVAGPLAWEMSTPISADVPPQRLIHLAKTIEFQAPFTLEATALLSPDSDPDASWSLVFEGDTQSPAFGILLNGHSFFSIIPTQPDFTSFVHIRPPGESNKLTLNVDTDNQATLRINDEVAWKGKVPALHVAVIQAIGGTTQASKITLQRLALYISHN